MKIYQIKFQLTKTVHRGKSNLEGKIIKVAAEKIKGNSRIFQDKFFIIPGHLVAKLQIFNNIMDSIILTDKNIQQNVKCHFWKYSNRSSSHILF